MDIANSGKTKYLIYVNPELEKKFSSVETLYGVPKAVAKVKRKSRLQTLNGSENYSSMNQ